MEDEAIRDIETNAFASLKIWRDKLQADLTAPDRGPDFKLRLLLEQGKDVEIAVQGCLKDALFELGEAVQWGLLAPQHAAQQRQRLINEAAIELENDKQLCLQLAEEHRVQGRYVEEIKRSINHTVADYESLKDLKFALLVWRTNLARDASLAAVRGGREGGVEDVLREGYFASMRLIHRCTTKSVRFWSVQSAAGDLASQLATGKRHVYTSAMQLVQRRLEEIAAQHGLPQATLSALWAEVSDPEAVPLLDDCADAPERPGREGVYEPSGDAGKERRISEESASTLEDTFA